MTHATSKRRGHGEDSIYWDASRNRYIGEVDLGFSPAGTRIRKKVSGKIKLSATTWWAVTSTRRRGAGETAVEVADTGAGGVADGGG
jgi:hypothetical protein